MLDKANREPEKIIIVYDLDERRALVGNFFLIFPFLFIPCPLFAIAVSNQREEKG